MYREEKYRTILEATDEELSSLKEKALDDRWKPIYHVHPQYGLLNDPNGLAYYNGYYHLFHQWYPFGTIHGMKHWAHLKSKNLVEWTREGVALIPTEEYESHGVYSGTAIEIGGNLFLYYTGNVKYDKEKRNANQCLAIMDKNGKIEKSKINPLINGVPKGYTGHVRDPKVFKIKDHYYMLLGAQRENLTGAIIIYKSKDGLQWDMHGELHLSNFNNYFGYMWECPDYLNIGGKDIIVFSPQGIQSDGEKFKNLFNVIYVVGNLDIENLEFSVESFHEFESGFDFYAIQSFIGKEKQILLLAWAGLGEFKYPTDKNMWAHCLTFPRELSLKNNKIIQKPAKELELLRDKRETKEGTCLNLFKVENFNNTYELNITLNSGSSNLFGINLVSSSEEKLVLKFDKENCVVSLDRSNMKNIFAEEYGFIRKANLNIDEDIKIKVLMDNSIAEIFINDGDAVFTTRIFPLEQSTGIEIFSDDLIAFHYNKYTLKRGILD
ncbi:MAG: glycoside hydrolase family 32 protein [Clostridiaceae bacterium]